MYVFSRSTIAALGKQFDALPAAVSMAERVSGIIGIDVSVFTTRFGGPLGTVTWTMLVDSMEQVQANTDKLMADAGYVEALDGMNGLFMAPAEDTLGRFVTPPIDAVTSRFYGITRASMADGQFGPAVEFGVKMADYLAKAQNTQASFVKAGYGGFADVAWIIAFDSAADVDAFDNFQMSDPGYHALVDGAAGLFAPNSGHTSLVEKLN
ncbi:MAG: hypothetical protein DRJ50_01465 [Actinobacteria bacterium]|nr:MAG: hypothetical protein DRJ50_01465 [Actinomycetota bacterium]